LTQRGLLRRKSHSNDFFSAGFLNKVYLRLNDIVFHGSRKVCISLLWLHHVLTIIVTQALILHIGDNASELDMERVDVETQARPSTLGTGGGTDHDDMSIRGRPIYRWEGILADRPRSRSRLRWWHWSAKLRPRFGAWFGIRPTWLIGEHSDGLSVDVVMKDGRYVLLEVATPTNSRQISTLPVAKHDVLSMGV
jgi:hypothetical protein